MRKSKKIPRQRKPTFAIIGTFLTMKKQENTTLNKTMTFT